MRRLGFIAAAIVLIAGLGVVAPGAAKAESTTQSVVDDSRDLMESLLTDPDFSVFRRTVAEAKGVLIVPTLIKAGFIVGAEGGNGVLVARTPSGGWSYPAFISMGAGSFGLQVGVEAQEVVFVLMTDKAVEAVISSEVKLGGDISFSAGPVGRGIEGSVTTAGGADIAAFSRSVGAFIGAAFEGAVLHERESYNAEYYQPGATAREIVQQGKWMNPGAQGLRNALAKY